MKTSVTEKESPGNLEEILRVKPKNRNSLSGNKIYWGQYT
jgi:hypothetical protein